MDPLTKLNVKLDDNDHVSGLRRRVYSFLRDDFIGLMPCNESSFQQREVERKSIISNSLNHLTDTDNISTNLLLEYLMCNPVFLFMKSDEKKIEWFNSNRLCFMFENGYTEEEMYKYLENESITKESFLETFNANFRLAKDVVKLAKAINIIDPWGLIRDAGRPQCARTR